ncbi:MAG: DUF1275 domain-containing protein, partial [Bdellovibrionaceae bacterium]|nr:DUF1275 domain-containing protein [Pseudobdellovibrionaceae bacterium]
GLFGRFGDVVNIEHDFFLLACLCGACGLQNAAITSASGATVRTTHLTGLTTDLGLGLVKTLVQGLSPAQKKIESQANLFRILTIISFTMGSVVAAFVYVKYQYEGFFVPMILALYSAYVARRGPSSSDGGVRS